MAVRWRPRAAPPRVPEGLAARRSGRLDGRTGGRRPGRVKSRPRQNRSKTWGNSSGPRPSWHGSPRSACRPANAVLGGADALMRSAETRVGTYPVDAVATIARIIEAAGQDWPFSPRSPPTAATASPPSSVTCRTWAFGPWRFPARPRRNHPARPPGTAAASAGWSVAHRLRRTDQLPQTRLRLGPHPAERQARSGDLVRARGIPPQPGQGQRPGQLTRPGYPEFAAALRPKSAFRIFQVEVARWTGGSRRIRGRGCSRRSRRRPRRSGRRNRCRPAI